jgi:hypothetical protein
VYIKKVEPRFWSYFFVPYSWVINIRGCDFILVTESKKNYKEKTVRYVFGPIFSFHIRGQQIFALGILKIFTKIIRKNCALRFRSHFFVPYSWATNIRVRNSENFYKDNKKKLRATESVPFFRSIFVGNKYSR